MSTSECTIAPACDQTEDQHKQIPPKFSSNLYYTRELRRLRALARDPESPLNSMIAHQKRVVRKWKNASAKTEKTGQTMRKRLATSTRRLEHLKKNHRILMHLVNLPIGRLPDDCILKRITFLKIYTNYPLVQIFEIPERDHDFIETICNLPVEEKDENVED